MAETANALYFVAPGKVELRAEKIEPRPGVSLVRSELIGVSHGTEMLLYKGDAPQGLDADLSLSALRGRIGYPIKYGYINVGLDEGGKRVFAFAPHQDLFLAPAGELIDIPPGMGPDDAVFLAHMETALGVVHDAAPLVGETALVLGQGTVGLLVAEILSRCRGLKVITVEPSELRRRASGAAGCVALSPLEKDLATRIDGLTQGRGVDLAINTSGSPAALQTAVDTLAFEGTVVEASWYGTRGVSLDLGRSFHRKRLTIKSSQVSRIGAPLSGRWDKGRRLGAALELIRDISPSKYITHRFPLRDAQRAFDLIGSSQGETVQVVLVPG